MTRGRATGLEQAIDGFAATAFAMCAAWALHLWGAAPVGAIGGAAVGGALMLAILGRVGPTHGGLAFDLVAVEFEAAVDDTLLLEDRLVEPSEDSQVVRLFAVGGGQPAHVPGELAARIDHYLGGAAPRLRAVPAQPDAAQELYEALADIRRTLR